MGHGPNADPAGTPREWEEPTSCAVAPPRGSAAAPVRTAPHARSPLAVWPRRSVVGRPGASVTPGVAPGSSPSAGLEPSAAPRAGFNVGTRSGPGANARADAPRGTAR